MYRGLFPSFSTIYIGGGSPSLVPAPLLVDLLNTLFKSFPFHSSPEVTVEVNPADQDTDWYRALFDSGVNRLIVGVQSLEDEDLIFLGRRHRAKDAYLAVEKAVKAGFVNIGIDLIYALPGQSMAEWIDRLNKALCLSPTHISCYELSVEEDTPFYAQLKAGTLKLPDEERKWQLFQTTDELLSRQGYIHYEVSNFAKKDVFLSRHNLLYWRRMPYLGLGPSAHSFDGHRRWWNVRSINDYLKCTGKAVKPIAGEEKLSPYDSKLEEIFLGLRTRDGISIETAKYVPSLDRLLREGYLYPKEDRLIPTCKGMALADQLALLICPD